MNDDSDRSMAMMTRLAGRLADTRFPSHSDPQYWHDSTIEQLWEYVALSSDDTPLFVENVYPEYEMRLAMSVIKAFIISWGASREGQEDDKGSDLLSRCESIIREKGRYEGWHLGGGSK